MRSLQEIVQDCRDTAALMIEHANELEELASFFGGAVKGPVQMKAEPQVHWRDQRQAVGQPPVAETVKRRGRGPGRKDTGKRPLTIEEKAAIRADWNALPPHQRTKVNRAALAAKHRCSPMQVHTITMDRSNMYEGKRQAYLQRQMQGR